MNATAFVQLLLTSLATITLCNLNEAHVLCTPCENRLDCNEPPKELCIWGEAQDACGRRVCAKGPGERCGGTFDLFGVCGEGMMCTTSFLEKNVDRCHGCSTYERIECYPQIR